MKAPTMKFPTNEGTNKQMNVYSFCSFAHYKIMVPIHLNLKTS